jgi:hypothetical protein
MSLRNWALDALRICAAFLTKEYVAPLLKDWAPQLADIVVDIIAIVAALIVFNALLSLLLGFPKITVVWKAQDGTVLTSTALRAQHPSSTEVHSFEVKYTCESIVSKLVNAHFRKQRARLLVAFDSNAVEVIPDLGVTYDGGYGSEGRLSLPLDSDVLNGTKTWCSFSLTPKSVPNNYEGEIQYSIAGDGKAMVVWSWFVKPKATVKALHLVRS